MNTNKLEPKTREEEIAEFAASLYDEEQKNARRIVHALSKMTDKQLETLVQFAQLVNEEEQEYEND